MVFTNTGSFVDVGNVLAHTGTFLSGNTGIFYVRARNAWGLGASAFTSTYKIPGITSGPTASSITSSSATLGWNSGYQSTYSLSIPGSPSSTYTGTTAESRSITGLSASTTYPYALSITSDTGQTATQNVYNTITGASTTGSVVTYTTNNQLRVGQTVMVTGVSPSAYNITGTVSAATRTSFSINAFISPGTTYSSGGVASAIFTTLTSAPDTPSITYSNVTASSFTVSWSATRATSYNVSIFETIGGASVTTLNGTTATVVAPSGLAPNRLYTTTVTAINSGGTSNNAANQRTSLGAALTPTFGANTSTSGGFTGSVTNYNSSYVWNISASPGSVSWGTPSGSTYPFTVTGLDSLQNSTVTVTTTRTNYDDGSNTTSGSSLIVQNPPTGGSVSVTPTTGIYGVTTFTASASGWSGTGTITYAFSWQRFLSNGSWQEVATGTTFAPTVAQGSTALAWRVRVTASNGVSPDGTATATFTVNNPPLPGTPTSLTATSNRSDGVNLVFSG
jgi:hypothetical protein